MPASLINYGAVQPMLLLLLLPECVAFVVSCRPRPAPAHAYAHQQRYYQCQATFRPLEVAVGCRRQLMTKYVRDTRIDAG